MTIADYASQAVIGNALAENFPDDAVLSEERSEEFMLLLNDQQRALVQRFVTDALGGYVFEEQICAWLDFGKQKTAPPHLGRRSDSTGRRASWASGITAWRLAC